MSITIIILICFIIFCFIMAMVKASGNSNKSTPTTVKSNFTEEQTHWLKTLGSLFFQNKALTIQQAYEACKMPNTGTSASENKDEKEFSIPFEKGTDGYNVVTSYAFALSRRYDLLYQPINICSLPNDINTKNGEIILNRIYGVTLYLEKTSSVSIAHSGLRWQNGPLRTGFINAIGNEITRFSPTDIGTIYVTNKRIVFVGKQKFVTKDVNIDNIIYVNLYQDGVMINQANRKPLLFKFDNKDDLEIYEKADGMNLFMISLQRAQAGDYMENKETQKMNSTVSSNSEDKDSLFNEALDFINSTDMPKTASSIQRHFSIGYERAYKILEQLKSQGLVH